MTQLIHLDGNSLTLEEVIAVARHGAQCELDEGAKEAVIASRKIVDDIVREKRVVYGDSKLEKAIFLFQATSQTTTLM